MTVASLLDEEEKQRRDAPMGDVSPSTISAGSLDDDPPAPETPDVSAAEVSGSAQGDGSPPIPALDDSPRGSDSSDWAQFQPPSTQPDTSKADFAKQLTDIVGRRYTPRPELSDAAISKARDSSRRGAEHDNFTAALSAALMRRPYTPPPPEDAAGELLQQRTKEEGNFQRDQSMQLALAKALKGEKGPATESPSLVDWRKAQADRLKGLEARDSASVDETKRKGDVARAAGEAEAGSLENERSLLLKDPRAKAFGVTPEMIAKLDRKGIEGVRRQIESVKQGKGGGGTPAKPVKAGDYAGVPDDIRETVKAIVEGRAPAPAPGSRFGAKILNYVTQIDPAFDSTKFGRYQHVSQAASGDATISSFNAAMGHIALARQAIPKNFDSNFINRLKNQVMAAAGSAQLTPFETEVQGVGDEYAKVMGIGTENGREHVLAMLSTAQSPQQIDERLGTLVKMMGEKVKARQFQLDASTPASVKPMELMSPEAKAAMGGGAPVKMKFPDGSVQDVEAEKVEKAKAKGGVPVDG